MAEPVIMIPIPPTDLDVNSGTRHLRGYCEEATGPILRTYIPTYLRILNRSQMTRTTPELTPPSPNIGTTPTGGRSATTYDLTCNRPHKRRIFSGIWFRN
ncbi:hypothetical protein AVEN_83027-1 [Araneus ventricosus]|uniref:Uncharacterized protein n=1 Tax=Araneus ventricosus TaxID=182803 RepID=A0A4Y2IRZ6_ARAVE|nr:hypothetical protein AVEN_83027-1 [Araneus ventricosus]